MSRMTVTTTTPADLIATLLAVLFAVLIATSVFWLLPEEPTPAKPLNWEDIPVDLTSCEVRACANV